MLDDDTLQYRLRSGKADRRDVLKAAVSSGLLVGVAGCTGQEEEPTLTPTPTEAGGGDTPTATETKKKEEGQQDGGDDTPTPTETKEKEETTETEAKKQANLVENTLYVIENTPPNQQNANPWAANPTTGATITWSTMDGMIQPENAGGKKFLSGHEWDVKYFPFKDDSKAEAGTYSIPTLVKDLTIKPPKTFEYTLDDRFNYWSGESLDAKAYELHHKINFLIGGGHLGDGEEFTNGVAIGDYKLRYKKEKAQSKLNIRRTAHPGGTPMPKEFTKPWVEKLSDASTQKEVDTIAGNLADVKISLSKFVKNEWGSGLYRIESPDAINETLITAKLWEDHPTAKHAEIPQLGLRVVSRDRQDLFQQKGKLDLWPGIISEKGRGHAYRRKSLPDFIQSSKRTLTEGGAQVRFDWTIDHFQRRNFRRAIVEAGNWFNIQRNWAGEHNIPMQFDTGLADTADQRWYDMDFVNKLYDYSERSNFERAAKFMEKAGYNKQKGNWIDPNGKVAEVPFTNGTVDEGWIVGAQTLKSNLEKFGIKVNLQQLQVSSWIDRMKKTGAGWGMSWLWYAGSHPLAAYNSNEPWWAPTMLYGVADNARCWNATKKEKKQANWRDTHNRPLRVTIPKEPGALEVEGDGEDVNLCDLFFRMRQPGMDTKDKIRPLAKKAARWYNYDVPDFRFKQDQWAIIRNVKDFNWPRDEHPSYELVGGWDDYLVKSGLAQATTDPNFPPPKEV